MFKKVEAVLQVSNCPEKNVCLQIGDVEQTDQIFIALPHLTPFTVTLLVSKCSEFIKSLVIHNNNINNNSSSRH